MGKIKDFIKWGRFQAVEYWDKPRKGECLSNKEGVYYTLMQSGMNIYNFMGINGFGFGAAATFAGAVMGIRQMDFATMGLIGSFMGYALMWISPINMLIYENHGVLNKNTKIYAHCGAAILMVLAIGLYCVPSSAFEGIIKGLPQLIANAMVIQVFNMYTDWFVRKKFSSKYGRIKPFILIYGLPIFVLTSAAAYFPANMEYTKKLILLNLIFGLLGTMQSDFMQQDSLIKFISYNTQERQRLYSIVPIFSYILVSFLNAFYPWIINGRQNSQIVYKICVPVFCGIGIVMASAAAGVKERVIENKSATEQKVKFFSAAKNVLKDKYLWISQLSGVFSVFRFLTDNLLVWWLLYTFRLSRWAGLIVTVLGIPYFFGHVTTVFLSRRFNKRPILMVSRVIRIIVLFGDLLAIHKGSLPLFIFFNLFLSFANAADMGISAGMMPDILDRHQWKYGERCDATMGVFNWFMPLLAMPLAYVMPFFQKQIGFSSDWNILYDNEIAVQVFSLFIIMNIVGVILTSLPYAFYNITNEQHRVYIKEIKERVAREQLKIEQESSGNRSTSEQVFGNNEQAAGIE